MDIISDNDEIKIKPAIPSLKCELMLNKALRYLVKKSLKQAWIMHDQFYELLSKLERQPGLGTKYKYGMRRIMLGKFRYFIYYREKETEIEIVGIQHTSMGTEFSED